MPDLPADRLWSPLRHPRFRSLWLASTVSNLGTLVHGVGAAWLMTSLAAPPLWAALVQTATCLPTVLLSLLAGALADTMDRRRLLVITQVWMLLTALGLGLLALLGQVTPWQLLAFTFALGIGSALNGPAWQAIMPELVPRSELTSTITLNSASFNLARAVGPALGGLLIGTVGVAATFLFNAASFLAVLGPLLRWQRPATPRAVPASMAAAVRTGLRYAWSTPLVRALVLDAGTFSLFASVLMALLPVLARHELGTGPIGYGLLHGCFGAGAVAGAVVLPPLRARTALRPHLRASTSAVAGALLVLATSGRIELAAVAMAVAGAAWLHTFALYNTTLQAAVPDWVRGRALALYLWVVFGAIAAASAGWGAIAGLLDVAPTLGLAALGLLATSWLPLPWHRELVPAELASPGSGAC